MEEALFFVQEFQPWIYLVLLLAGVIYLKAALSSWRELRAALFGLERERAQGRLLRAVAMLVLVVCGALATFILSTFVSPAIVGFPEVTPLPTISLLTPSVLAGSPEGPLVVESNLTAEPGMAGEGCANPQATLVTPKAGDTLSGGVDIFGSASILNFAFYKLEYADVTAGSPWRAISAGVETVTEDSLGAWDTSLLLPGDYLFRLVVTDTAGNAPLPCVIRVRILPPP